MSVQRLIYPMNLDNLPAVLEIMGGGLKADFTLGGIRNTQQRVGSTARFGDDGIEIADEYYNDTILTARNNKYDTGIKLKPYQATTDTGKHVRQHPYKGTSGTGAIVPGLYPLIYGEGKHGDYPALIQRPDVPFYVYRDSDQDDTLELSNSTIEKGYGFNCHRRRGDRVLVGQASGGCQVPLVENDFEELIHDFRTWNKGQYCSYFLINSHWLNDLNAAEKEWAAIQEAISQL